MLLLHGRQGCDSINKIFFFAYPIKVYFMQTICYNEEDMYYMIGILDSGTDEKTGR